MTSLDASTSEHADLDATASDSAAGPAAAAGAVQRGYKTKIEGSVLVLTRSSGATSRFDVAALPPDVQEDQKIIGLRSTLMNSRDPDARYAELQAGKVTHRDLRAPRPENPWKVAIAHAWVEESKKGPAPLSLPRAQEMVAGLDRDQLRTAKSHPTVVKHFHKANGGSAPSLSAMLGLGGSAGGDAAEDVETAAATAAAPIEQAPPPPIAAAPVAAPAVATAAPAAEASPPAAKRGRKPKAPAAPQAAAAA